MQTMYTIFALIGFITCSQALAMNDNNAPAPYSNDPVANNASIAAFVARGNKCLENARNNVHSEIPANPAPTISTDRENDTISLQTALLETTAADNEIETLLERTRRAIRKVQQATNYTHETYGHGSTDYTVEEDYQEPRATYRNSVSTTAFSHDNDNNAPANTTAPKIIVDETQRVINEIGINPAKTFEILMRYYSVDYTGFSRVDEKTGSTPFHDTIDQLMQHRDSEHWQKIYLSIGAALAAGAHKDVVNNAGKTPLDLALEYNDEMLIQLLTTENLTKETLVTLALEHNLEGLLQHLVD